jgi:hypothetical protein
MRTFDFSPLSRSTIGFERLFDQLNNAQRADSGENYRPMTSCEQARNIPDLSGGRRLLPRRH